MAPVDDHPQPSSGPAGPVVPFDDLERLEALIADSYESAYALADAGVADFDHLGEPIARALLIVRRLLAESAA